MVFHVTIKLASVDWRIHVIWMCERDILIESKCMLHIFEVFCFTFKPNLPCYSRVIWKITLILLQALKSAFFKLLLSDYLGQVHLEAKTLMTHRSKCYHFDCNLSKWWPLHFSKGAQLKQVHMLNQPFYYAIDHMLHLSCIPHALEKKNIDKWVVFLNGSQLAQAMDFKKKFLLFNLTLAWTSGGH